MLEVKGLTVRFGHTVAVDDVTTTVPPGTVLAVLGPSGCGKSTLLRAVAGLEAVAAGHIRFDGSDITRTPTHRRGFALMFQDGQLLSHLTVDDNIGYPLRLRRVPRHRRTARVDELLSLVGLPGYGGRVPATLSGGEQQRVALARALAVRPRLLLLDEPLSALDRDLRERLATELRDILRAEDTTALLVTHDHDEAFAVADRMAVMRRGRLVQQGSLEKVWRHPVDAETARFLGYARVVAGTPAAVLLRAAGLAADAGTAVALRRSALVVAPGGRLAGTVVSARTAVEQTRLVVDVPDVGHLDAVAGLEVAVRPGDRVSLTIDPTRAAFLDVGGPDPIP